MAEQCFRKAKVGSSILPSGSKLRTKRKQHFCLPRSELALLRGKVKVPSFPCLSKSEAIGFKQQSRTELCSGAGRFSARGGQVGGGSKL